MKGFNIAEEGHVVNILPPVSIVAATQSDVFSMKNFGHASIIVQAGVTDADAGNITILACDNFTPSNTTAIDFSYCAEETAAGDTLTSRTAAAAATGIDVSANNGITYVIEIDAAQLPAGKPNLQLNWSIPGGATLVSAVAILSGARYSGDQNATAIA
jgi:hypothetical protein